MPWIRKDKLKKSMSEESLSCAQLKQRILSRRTNYENDISLKKALLEKHGLQTVQELTKELKPHVKTLTSNQKTLHQDVKVLREETSYYTKNVNLFMEENQALRKEVQALGNVDAWAMQIAAEVDSLNKALEDIEKSQNGEQIIL